MKIVHLCLSAFFIDNYSYQENMLPKYHVKMGHQVTVIASLFTFGANGRGRLLDGYSEYDDKNGFHIVRLPYKKPLMINRILRRYERFEEVLNRENPDIIFSHNVSYANISELVKYLKKHPNVKVFADNHADFVNSAKNLFSKHILHPIIWRHYAKMLEPYLTKCYGVIPVRCRFLKEMYHINPQIIEYLPMGVDDESIPKDRLVVRKAIRKELSIPENDFVILSGGKIDRLKNIHILVEVLKAIDNKNLHLVICGTLTPDMEYLKTEFDMNPNIHYLGWCDAGRVMNCMVASDIVCFPGTHSSLWEQSVGVGLPAIFNRWPEMEHVNVCGNCLFVKGDDEEELKSAISTMLNVEEFKQFKSNSVEASINFLYSEISKKAIQL